MNLRSWNLYTINQTLQNQWLKSRSTMLHHRCNLSSFGASTKITDALPLDHSTVTTSDYSDTFHNLFPYNWGCCAHANQAYELKHWPSSDISTGEPYYNPRCHELARSSDNFADGCRPFFNPYWSSDNYEGMLDHSMSCSPWTWSHMVGITTDGWTRAYQRTYESTCSSWTNIILWKAFDCLSAICAGMPRHTQDYSSS